MHRYRSHTCGALRPANVGDHEALSGWVRRVRDHGGLLFIDLRDHYGLTQVVADPDSPAFKVAETVRSEWVIRVDGKARPRPAGTENADLPTGAVELFASEIEVLSAAAELPLPVFGDAEYPEETRLKYRFLDLRRDKLGSSNRGPPALSGRVLLVDDEQRIVNFVRRGLEAEGLEVDTAGGGAEGLRLARSRTLRPSHPRSGDAGRRRALRLPADLGA